MAPRRSAKPARKPANRTAGNPVRGDGAIEIAGKRAVLRFTTNALCAAEEAAGYGVPEMARRLRDGTMFLSDFRALMWAGLLHERPGLTLEAAGMLMDEIGMDELECAILEAFIASMPKRDDDAEAADDGDADPTGAGTGRPS